jgi:hypothetical protein
MAKRNKTKSQIRTGLIPAPLETETRYGSERGFYDPNPSMSHRALLGGNVNDLGEYAKMRYAHWIIGNAADHRKNEIKNMQFVVAPRNGESSTLDQRWCARAVAIMLKSNRYFNLSHLVADIDDRVGTYGFACYELQVANTHVQLHPVSTYCIQEIKGDNETIESVVIRSAIGGLREISPPRLVWFGDPPEPGMWYGQSRFRRVLSVVSAQAQDIQLYLEQRRAERGWTYIQETGSGSEQSRRNAVDFLVDFFNGKFRPYIAGGGMELKHLAAANPGNSEFVARMQHFDSQIREAVNASLNSLGISGAGSRALGQEFRIADAKKFAASIKATCQLASGGLHPLSNWLATVVQLLGFDPADAPVIEPDGDIEFDVSEKLADIMAGIEKGIIPLELVKDEKNQRRIVESLGLHWIDPTPAVVTPEVTELSREPDEPGAPTYTPPQSVINAASDAYAVHMATPTAERVLTASETQTMRLLMNGAPLPRWKVERLAAQLRLMNPTTVRQTEEWAQRGPEWQRWNAAGGDAGVEWVTQAIAGVME